MRAIVFFSVLFSVSVVGSVLGAELEVTNGSELAFVLGGGEWNGEVLDDGDVVVLGGEDEVFVMMTQPEPYYKGLNFTVRTAVSRPADKRQVTIRCAGPGKAEIFTMTAGKVALSNIMLEGWNHKSCCPAY